MADKDFTKRLQLVEERLDKLRTEQQEFFAEVSRMVMDLAGKQNLLVSRLEESGWLTKKSKIIRTVN